MRVIIAALLSLLAFSAPAMAWNKAAMNSRIDATNFLVDEGCSGTLVAPDEILTAAHCVVKKYKTVEKDVFNEKGQLEKKEFQISEPGTVSQQFYAGADVSKTISYSYTAGKDDVDRKLDLALLHLKNKLDNAPSPISCAGPERGDTVYAVGNSFGFLYSTVTKGMVSSLTRSYRVLQATGDLGDTTDDGEHGLIQHSAVIAPGNSGGALFNDKGELIGVNVRIMPQLGGFSFAVPLDDVRGFLKSHKIEPDCK